MQHLHQWFQIRSCQKSGECCYLWFKMTIIKALLGLQDTQYLKVVLYDNFKVTSVKEE